MFNFQYVPVLKGRIGEFGALEMLPSNSKTLLLPIIEIPPIPWDYKGNQPAKTIDQHLQKIAPRIERAWGREHPILIDLMWLEGDDRMANGANPASHLFAEIRNLGVHAVPVTSLSRNQEYQRAYRSIIQQDGRGACIRLQREDFEEYEDLESRLTNLISELSTRERESDLILDLRAMTSLPSIENTLDLIDRLPRLDVWRSFTLCGTGFPTNLMGLPPRAISLIPRTEWTFWTELVSTKSLPRSPSFGDYGVSSPEPSEADPRVMRPSASIRYTSWENWLILKGQNLRDHGFGQFHQVSQTLTSAPEYRGPDFSWGDRYVRDCAGRVVGTGSLTTWRKVGTSHHIMFVLEQLANFSAL